MRPSSWRHAAKWASHTRTRTHSSKSTTEHLPRISRAHTCAQHRPIGTSVRESEGHTVRLHGQYRQVGGAVCLSVASREVSDKSVVSKSAALCVYLWRHVTCPINLSCRATYVAQCAAPACNALPPVCGALKGVHASPCTPECTRGTRATSKSALMKRTNRIMRAASACMTRRSATRRRGARLTSLMYRHALESFAREK
eukprot:6276220-Prymnesium_polylepis.1